jgi:serine O-acetyltransferase
MGDRFREYINLIQSDLYRYFGKNNWFIFVRLLIFHPGYKISFWMRTCKYLHSNLIFRYSLFIIARLIYQYYSSRFGIEIPFRTKIGPGLYIGHFNGIVIHYECVIGKNCNLLQNVTIGRSFRGDKKGVPTIGNNVFFGPGAVVFGDIKIGDNVAVGANAVVLKNVPDNAVVVGVPSKIVSYKGTKEYISHPI